MRKCSSSDISFDEGEPSIWTNQTRRFFSTKIPKSTTLLECANGSFLQKYKHTLKNKSTVGVPWVVKPFATTSAERREVQRAKTFHVLPHKGAISMGTIEVAPTRYGLKYINDIFWYINYMRNVVSRIEVKLHTKEETLLLLKECERGVYEFLVKTPLSNDPFSKGLLRTINFFRRKVSNIR